MKKKLPTILITILICGGLTILLYPTISKLSNQKYQMNAITDYNESIAQMQAERILKARREAEAYNAALTGADIEDPFVPGSGAALPENYKSILDFGSGMMGYIEIPAINVNLPIYHGTSDEVLEKGVGHMEMTALPVGGTGNHSILTGHTGLPNAQLFTDLVKLVVGDIFFVRVIDETLAYEVDQIMVVDPTDTAELKPIEDKDYVTLITCTPYAVNTHRLLVRGQRTSYSLAALETTNQAEGVKIPYNLVISLAAIIVVSIIIIWVRTSRWRKRNKKGGDS